MKYIIIRSVSETVEHRYPIIFSEQVAHSVIALSLLNCVDFCDNPNAAYDVVGAGFTDGHSMVYGSSGSLELTANHNDLLVIKFANSMSSVFDPLMMASLEKLEHQKFDGIQGEAAVEPYSLDKKIDEIDEKLSHLVLCLDGLLAASDTDEHQCGGGCGGCSQHADNSDQDEDILPAVTTLTVDEGDSDQASTPRFTLELSNAEHRPKADFNPPPRKKIPSKLF